MAVEDDPATTQPLHDPETEVIAFLKGRSAPCPRCAYDLRDIRTARCPECGEPLILKVGSPKARFGWLVLAMAPGCFSGVAALFVLIPVGGSILRLIPPAGVPWPIKTADGFGFLSAASVGLMYMHRHRIMSWTAHRQGIFAGAVWGAHVLMFALLVFAMWYGQY